MTKRDRELAVVRAAKQRVLRKWPGIKTWRERCNRFDNMHITTTGDIEMVMQEEIEELRCALTAARRLKGKK